MELKNLMDKLFGKRIQDKVDEGLKKVKDRTEGVRNVSNETRTEVATIVAEAEKVAGFFQGAGPDLIALLAKTEGRILVVPVRVGKEEYPRATVGDVQSQYPASSMDDALRDCIFGSDRARCLRLGIEPSKTYQFIAMLVLKEEA